MKMVSKTSKSALWTVAILLVTTNLIFAAPSNNNDESSGSRGFLKVAGGSAPVDFDVIPAEPDNALQVSLPYQDIPVVPARQPSFENAILNYLTAKHLMMTLLNSKTRSRFSDWDGTSNELSRKRSYSKYCAFNAVSCFG